METILAAGGLTAAALGALVYRMSYMGDDLASGEHSESISYSEFVQHAQTGDLILTSGAALTSMSRVVTKSIWSHCGMVYKDKKTGVFYEWSSHNSSENLPNTSGTPCGGTQLVPLDYLASDNGFLHWRRVHLEDWQREKIYQVVDMLKYNIGFSQIPEFFAYFGPAMASTFNGFGTGMVCSHTVALTYITAEAVALDRELSQYAPTSFSDTGDATWLVPVDERVKMIIGFDTSRLIKLTSPIKTCKLKGRQEQHVQSHTTQGR